MAIARTYAALRIFKPEGGSAADVAGRLGIEASYSHEVGDPVSPRSDAAKQYAMWTLSTQTIDAGSLQHHLEWLLERVEPAAAALHELSADGYDVDWFCFVSLDDAANAGVSLGPEVLQRLAALPAVLDLDIYA